jgi:hypothetical protein
MQLFGTLKAIDAKQAAFASPEWAIRIPKGGIDGA